MIMIRAEKNKYLQIGALTCIVLYVLLMSQPCSTRESVVKLPCSHFPNLKKFGACECRTHCQAAEIETCQGEVHSISCNHVIFTPKDLAEAALEIPGTVNTLQVRNSNLKEMPHQLFGRQGPSRNMLYLDFSDNNIDTIYSDSFLKCDSVRQLVLSLCLRFTFCFVM